METKREICKFIFFLCIVLMSACGLSDGSKNKESGSDESSVGYVMEYSEGSIQGEIRNFHFYGGVLYRSEQEGAIAKLYRCGKEGENSSDELVLSLEKGEILLDFAVLSDGRLVAAILNKQDIDGEDEKTQNADSESGFALKLYDSRGTYLQEAPVPEMEGSYAFARLRVTQEGNIVLALDHCACMLREDGTILWLNRGLDFLVMGVYAMEDGGVILTEASSQGMTLNQIGMDGQVSRQTGTVPSFVQIVDSERGLYAVGNGCLYKVEETGNRIEVLSLAAQGITSTMLEAVSKEGDTYAICIFDRAAGNTYQLVSLKEKEGAIEKAVLYIALTDDFIGRSPMGSFNMRSKTHRVVAKKYSDDSLSARDAQIDASMLTEDAPDLLCMWGQERYENYASKGALLDVTDLVPREDYLERTLDDYTVDGRIYGFPQYFSFLTLFCASEDLKGRTDWNLEEFMDFMEEHPTALMDPQTSPESERMEIFMLSFMRGIYEFIDFEKGIASFDSDGFRRYLRRLNELNITAVTETKYERARKGETILWHYPIGTPSAMTEAAALVGQDREFTLIGYPDGKNGSGGLIDYSAALGINAKTKEADAAKEFFVDWLEAGDAWSKYHFPITKHGFEEVISRAKEVTYQKDQEGNLICDEEGNPVEEGAYWGLRDPYAGIDIEFVVYAMTDEQERKLRDAVDKCIAYSRGEQTIKSMVREEVETYFTGQVGLEETVDKIQRRVQLLLDEGK